MFQSKVNRLGFVRRDGEAASAVLVAALCTIAVCSQNAMAQTASDIHESERSDKVTGGRIEGAEFDANEPDLKVTLNVPSFRLTLWQNGKEVKSYFVGVGLKDLQSISAIVRRPRSFGIRHGYHQPVIGCAKLRASVQARLLRRAIRATHSAN